MKGLWIFLFLFLSFSVDAALPSRVTPNLYFIDAHSQMDHRVDEERVISLMDHGGVYRTFLSSHLKRDPLEIVSFSKEYPDRILPSVKIKGQKVNQRKHRSRFSARLAKQANNSDFKAMAEVLIWHDSMGGQFQEVRTDFDDDQVLEALKVAKHKGWPFIVHIEFNSLSDDDRKSYMNKLKTFLNTNPKQPVILIHMAQLESDSVKALLDEFPNVYFMTSHATNKGKSGKPFINMFKYQRLTPQWKRLIVEYPEHFIFALDMVFSKMWVPRKYLKKEMSLWWKGLSELPDEVAHAVAHGNAERLWNVEPKPEDVEMYPPWITKKTMGPVTGYSANRLNK
jgi:predicted TIM-barrel fold metal-dependent hydrolase